MYPHGTTQELAKALTELENACIEYGIEYQTVTDTLHAELVERIDLAKRKIAEIYCREVYR